jgi:hypothetical protein
LDGVLGHKRRGDVTAFEEAGPGKRAQVMVSIKSDGTLSSDAEEKIEPIIKTEIRGWFEGGRVMGKQTGVPEQQIMVQIDQDTRREPQYAVTMAPRGTEVVKRDVTITTMGPVVHKDVEVSLLSVSPEIRSF